MRARYLLDTNICIDIARAAGLTLVTNNERELRRVQDLEVENWAVPSSETVGEPP